jgi:hypothetical protein
VKGKRCEGMLRKNKGDGNKKIEGEEVFRERDRKVRAG